MTERVELFEVGPRDGLQNEPGLIATQDKIALVDALSQAGFARIEAASFVSPKWVPQMADSAEVMAGIARHRDVGIWALAPNRRGLERALEARVDGIGVFGSATEGFSQANLNASREVAAERFRPLVAEAKAQGLSVRGYVSVVTDCPYEGEVPSAEGARAVALYRDMGCTEISLGETLGHGTPERVDAMLRAVLSEMPAEQLAGHFHDTGGRALDNIEIALSHGVRIFDAAVGGLGGCPYAPGAAGNVATEAVLGLMSRLGFETGLDAVQVERAAALARAMRSTQGEGTP